MLSWLYCGLSETKGSYMANLLLWTLLADGSVAVMA